VSTLPAKAPKIDLFEISAMVYNLLSKRTDHNTFVTTLDKLDSLISDRQDMDQAACIMIGKIDYSPNKCLVDNCLAKFP